MMFLPLFHIISRCPTFISILGLLELHLVVFISTFISILGVHVGAPSCSSQRGRAGHCIYWVIPDQARVLSQEQEYLGS